MHPVCLPPAVPLFPLPPLSDWLPATLLHGLEHSQAAVTFSHSCPPPHLIGVIGSTDDAYDDTAATSTAKTAAPPTAPAMLVGGARGIVDIGDLDAREMSFV